MARNSFVFGLLAAALLASRADAQTCTSYPNALTNGTVADASQVMANFNCAALVGAPNFTGNASFAGNASISGNLSVTGTTTFTGTSTFGANANITGNLSVTGTSSITGNASFSADVGIGTTSPSNPLTVVAPSTATSGTITVFNLSGAQSVAQTGSLTFYGVNSNPTYSASSGTIATLEGLRSLPENTSGGTITTLAGTVDEPTNGSTGAVTNLYGTDAVPENTSSGTVSNMKGVNAQPTNTGSGAVTTMYAVAAIPSETSTATGTVGTMYGVYSTPNLSGAATVTDMYGLYSNCLNGNASGSVTNCFQLYLDTPTLTGTITNIYGVYQKYASATNYFAGKIGIGTTSPAQALEVNGEVKVDTFASAAATTVCENGNVLSSCSSSIRYKENVKNAPFGLNDVMQMRPVTFKWKGRDENDLGLIAEEVAKINPLFVTYKDGKIEGVKYAQLTAVLVNAIKELKGDNDAQASQIAQLQTQISELRRVVGRQETENAALNAGLADSNRRIEAVEARLRIRAAANDNSGIHVTNAKIGQ